MKKERDFVNDPQTWSRQQKKEVRRLLAHEVILGVILLAEEAREGFLGYSDPIRAMGEHETLFSRVSRVLLNWQQLAILSPMVRYVRIKMAARLAIMGWW